MIDRAGSWWSRLTTRAGSAARPPSPRDRLLRVLLLRDRLLRDLALAAVLAAAELLLAVNVTLDPGVQHLAYRRPTTVLLALVVIGPDLCLIGRRRFPVAAVILGAVAQALTWLALLVNYYLAMAVLLYSAAAHGGRRGRRWAAGIGGALVAFTLVGYLSDRAPLYGLVIVALTNTAAVSLGSGVADRQAALEAIQARAAETERTSALARITAITEERNRIARDLHDVVAHGLSVIVVQATAAQRVLDRAPDRARFSLTQIEDTARAALVEMRQVVGAMRTGGEDDWRPAPGLAGLDELLDDFRSTGMEIRLHRTPDRPGGLPPTIDATAYRVVQESLTNVLKHAGPGARASVTIDHRDDGLRLTVTDNGRGAAAEAGGGHGLRGMAERAAVFGGRFRAGPHPGGGYRVEAVLPLTDDRPAVAP